MKRRLPVYEHPVRERRTIVAGGSSEVARTVYCTLQSRTAYLAECASCCGYQGLSFNASLRRARVRCGASPVEGQVFSVSEHRVVCAVEDVEIGNLSRVANRLPASGLVVVNSCDEPIGTLDGDEMARAAECSAKVRSAPAWLRIAVTVRELMRPLTLRVPENASMAMAAKLLPASPLAATPVVATDGTVVGSVSLDRVHEWMMSRA